MVFWRAPFAAALAILQRSKPIAEFRSRLFLHPLHLVDPRRLSRELVIDVFLHLLKTRFVGGYGLRIILILLLLPLV